jgi:hypothetical protein
VRFDRRNRSLSVWTWFVAGNIHAETLHTLLLHLNHLIPAILADPLYDSAPFPTATKWDLPSALHRLDKCLAWRRVFGCNDLAKMHEECSAEVSRWPGVLPLFGSQQWAGADLPIWENDGQSPSGKQFVVGYSTEGQPVRQSSSVN